MYQERTEMAIRVGMWKSNADSVQCVQPKDGAKGMVREVVVTRGRILVNFEEQMRCLRNVHIFLGDQIIYEGQPRFQQVQ